MGCKKQKECIYVLIGLWKILKVTLVEICKAFINSPGRFNVTHFAYQ